MEERIRFIDHRAKKFLVDFSNCSASEVEETARAAPDYITVKPRGSVLVLTDFTGAAFDRDTLRAMKEAAVDKPFVRKSALMASSPQYEAGRDHGSNVDGAQQPSVRTSLSLVNGRLTKK